VSDPKRTPRSITAATARRFLVKRHYLAPPRSLPAEAASVIRVVDRIGSLQFDPLEIAGRNHDLVLLARVAGYRREWTERLLYEDRELFEAYNKGLSLLPTRELPWYRLTWDRARSRHEGGTFEEHATLVEELLHRVRRDGPLSSIDIEPRAAIDWYWRPTNQVRAILEALAEAGILGLARRDGNRRVYDLAERLFPAPLLEQRRGEREQRQHRLLSRYRAHGLLGRSGSQEIFIGTAESARVPGAVRRTELLDELVAAGRLVPVDVEGLRGERYVVADEIELLDEAEAELNAAAPPGGHAPGVAFLAPLDPFVWDRRLLVPLFGFDYVWEVYVPEKRRRWGYYVLPVLYGDRLVGRIEPRIERRSGTLSVAGLWWEDGFDPFSDTAFVPAFTEALEAHRRFGDAARIVFPRVARHRPLIGAVRDLLAVSPEPSRTATPRNCRPGRTSGSGSSRRARRRTSSSGRPASSTG
jgi:uncharacterized protein